MDKKAGMYAALLTLAGVLGFALSMITASSFGNYLASMLIAWGFVPMICSFAAYSKKGAKAISYTAIAFATVYVTLIMMVYFAQLTTVRLEVLNEQTKRILDYTEFGLFFNYNLLGYAFMALATFFIGWTVNAQKNRDKWLKGLLLAHGIFAFICVIPLLGVFHPNMQGGEWIGILILELWCLYFTPVCILSYLHFKSQ
ncbi:Uncharacterized [Syntrophomonas zehnderi OL-4]|uniref:Uncharacterized n=1 Tax=Syntrophomonas zehnderi OL-4 TaxID=690567 RepID=A0A0E4C8T6_9FIRM|nr:hypothetical protein [Syntrophomonas zehnderi]CFX70469.1 Uncharacterized [Syntrophomonas zehnderi OL-4]